MAIVIDMPKLSDTMEEGVIAKWNVKEGDTVKSGDIIAEVETDKATMDVEVFDGGTILKIMAKEGQAVPLGGIMAIIGEKGEDISDLLDGDSEKESSSKDAKSSKDDSKDDKKSESKESKISDSKDSKLSDIKDESFDPLFGDIDKDSEKSDESSNEDDDRVKASPLARKMASEQGISLSNVKGSGPNGRVVKKDVESFDKSEAPSKAPSAPKVPAFTNFEVSNQSKEHKISQMRKTIAKRLAESKFTSPHFYETIDIDMKNAISAREAMNAPGDVKISFNDLVVKACAKALRLHPKINSSWMGDVLVEHGGVHVAIAVAIEDGLVTPVIRNADIKGLAHISAETRDLAGKARDKKLQPEDWEGSTFTISNLGMFGIEEFTAIINPPNAAILAVGAIRDVPVVENGAVVPGKRMKVTLSSDHRVVDGASCAEFLGTVRRFLENPTSMLVY